MVKINNTFIVFSELALLEIMKRVKKEIR